MVNEQARADMADILEGVQEQMRTIARLQQERATLTATATVRRHVTVTVNADNVVIETKFGPDVEDLSYAEIAKAVTEAAKQASADMARQTSQLLEPLNTQRARMPKLSDLVEGMPEITVPEQVKAPTTAPNSPTRVADADKPMEFSGTVDPGPGRDRGGSVTDSSW
ncbi:YbaB/EbfC family nucleoid-associated protein [Nocardia caishijiensis]|uniref:YbaB/EbfC DNA-binding family protein n=1 Tax=Nocardia caishijiensis TaxID=184756 RepID=A0ABQ6YRN6_9NOCA|nr:YbaB/EbfC family nucleoid-associated protein [Nocardia caishijiensis]KAF0848240.1 YbaB/EbfC DNA-binding family protein [Nocardia caishijiensis]